MLRSGPRQISLRPADLEQIDQNIIQSFNPRGDLSRQRREFRRFRNASGFPVLGGSTKRRLAEIGQKRCSLEKNKTIWKPSLNLSQNKRNPCFKGVLTCFECENKAGVVRVLIIFQECSAISFKRSRWELSIDVAEQRSISKNKGVVRI